MSGCRKKNRSAAVSTPRSVRFFRSYAQSAGAPYRRGAIYVDNILKGANPADLPVDQATTYDLVVNAKTAEALGLTFPTQVAAQVTEWVQ